MKNSGEKFFRKVVPIGLFLPAGEKSVFESVILQEESWKNWKIFREKFFDNAPSGRQGGTPMETRHGKDQSGKRLIWTYKAAEPETSREIDESLETG